jgi:asparagine synthetase B (glutamine-hydrolysing)
MPSKLLHINEDLVLTEMNKIYSSIFKKMAAYCDKHSNLPIFLPLSGGMDSRFIAWAIKKNNIKNRIIAFTYGKSSNTEEALISKQVAESFNWNWVFIEYSNYEWQQVKIDLIQLTKDFSIHKSSIHINDYIAIKYLKNNFGKGIVLVGHLMDHFAGLSIPNELKFNNTIKVDNLIWGNPIYDNRLSSYEHFYKNTRTATYIINSIRMYEYFELKYCLPYANIELATLWYSLPTTYRIERNLFRIYLNKYAYINEYKFLLDIPIALGRRMDDKFIELNKIDKTKIVMKYYLKKINVINLIKKTQKEKIRKSNAEGDYIGFYELFDDKDLGFDKFDKNYLELVAMSVIKNIKY